MNLENKFFVGLKKHLVDTTAIQTVVSPILATIETTIVGMSNEHSLNARLLGTGLGYVGLGFVYTKGLHFSRKLFKIGDETLERVKQFHDSAYSVVYTSALQPALYYVAGLRDPKEIAVGTAGAISLALVIGGPVGYSIDLFGDFTGIRKNNRVPNSLESLASTFDKSLVLKSATGYIAEKIRGVKESVKGFSKKTKIGIASLLVAGSIGVVAGVYELNSESNSKLGVIATKEIYNSK